MILMTINIKQLLVTPSKYNLKCPYTMDAQYLTIHNTANDASAANEINYMVNNNHQVSYHFAVDDQVVIQGLPLNRNGWHCGDGQGHGNMQSIGIEICYSKSGGERYVNAEILAIQLIAQLLHEREWKIDRVKKHQDWSGKYCPHRILDEGRWASFLNRVQKELDKLNGNKGGFTMSQYEELKADCQTIFQQLAFINTMLGIVDRPVNKSHEKGWAWAQEQGLLNGQNPQKPLTREQFSTVLYRLNNQK